MRQELINYFHDCFKADNNSQTFNNFLSATVENTYFFTQKEELLNDFLPIVPIPPELGEEISKNVLLFEREKELIYGSFFIVGKYTSNLGRQKRLCSPLFYHHAEISERDGDYFIEIDSSQRKLNVNLLNEIGVDKGFYEDYLLNGVLTEPITKTTVGDLILLFKRYLPSLETEHLVDYPNLVNLSTLKKTRNEGEAILPSSAIGLVKKAESSRGILNELKDLTKVELSLPLQSLFQPVEGNEISNSHVDVPLHLSEIQTELIRSSRTNSSTVIIGPPGTGKSYTISAIALDHMIRGESVLVVSKNNEAVDVIHNKIKDVIGFDKFIIRGGKKREYKTSVNQHLRNLIDRSSPFRYLSKLVDHTITGLRDYNSRSSNLKDSLKLYERKTDELKNHYNYTLNEELRWGNTLQKAETSFWNALKSKFIEFKNKRQTPIWEIESELKYLDNFLTKLKLNQLKYNYIESALKSLNSNWKEFKQFYTAFNLKSETQKKEAYQKLEFEKILPAFPIWLTRLHSLEHTLPLNKGMFDVVIIDEASQCDIASCLPAIQRGKRLVIAGDPQQLKHTSFVSKTYQNTLISKYNLKDDYHLDYRNRSILDVALKNIQSRSQVGTLDEHYRSKPSIIGFSNEQFYDNMLKVMSQKPNTKNESLFFVNVTGTRDKQGKNQEEVNAIIAKITDIIEQEKTLNSLLCSSIGIISPFRSQADLIAKNIREHFDLSDITKHKIMVGTPYHFQGEERDIMLLSMCIDENTHHSALIHLNKPDVFNVSITRARSEQYIYTSIDKKKLPATHLLYQYLSFQTPNPIKVKDNYHDKFSEEVVSQLKNWNIKNIWTSIHIANTSVDILIHHKKKYIGIDLIGYPGQFEGSIGLEDYRVLNRAGITIIPFPYSNWHFTNEDAVKELKQLIK